MRLSTATAAYLKQLLLTIFYVLSNKTRINFYIGIDCLNALTGLLLARLGFIKKVIFYSQDYVPVRFRNPILNMLYHWMDRLCVNHSDYVWNLSVAMEKERRRRGVIKKPKGHHLVVPVGSNFRRIKRLPSHLVNRKKIVYMGRLEELFGLQHILDALPEIVRKIPDVQLVVIGAGSMREQLEEFLKDDRLQSNIKYLGFIGDHCQAEKILAECSVGLAPYPPNPLSYKTFTDVGKPKIYMACGLPVIITDVPPIAKVIQACEAGIIIQYQKNQLAEAVCRLLTDQDLFNRCRDNAIALASQYDWEDIFRDTFSKLMKKEAVNV